MKYFIIFILGLIPIHSCSTFKEMGQNQSQEGHYRLYTYPEKIRRYLELEKHEEEHQTLEEGKVRFKDVVIVSINDFHSKLEPTKIQYLDKAQNSNHEIIKGGITGYKAYFDILRKKLTNSLQIISSGSMFAKDTPAQKTIFYLNYLGLDVANIGLSELELPYPKNYLEKLDYELRNAKFDTVLSNAFDLSQNEPLKLNNIVSSTIKTVGDLKIGYIGIIAPNVIGQVDSKKLTGIYFEQIPVKILKNSTELRKSGADIIIAMISEGIDCTSQQSQELNIDEYKVNFLPTDSKICNNFQNLTIDALSKLPPNYVDVVFTSGKNSKVINFINSYPVIQNFANGTDFSWVKLTYDFKLQRVVKEKTQILQPVSTCHNFFKETQDCFTGETLRNVELEKAHFLNTKVKLQKIPIHK